MQFYTPRELTAVRGSRNTDFMDKLKLSVTRHFAEEDWDGAYLAAMQIKSAMETLSSANENSYLHRWWSPRAPQKIYYKTTPNNLPNYNDGVVYAIHTEVTRDAVKVITNRPRAEIVRCMRALRPFFKSVTARVGVDIDEEFIELTWVTDDINAAPNQLIIHRGPSVQ